MTRIVGCLCLPRHKAAKASQAPTELGRRFSEWSRRESSDVDGKPEGEQAGASESTPYKKFSKNVFPVPKTTDKTVPRKEFAQ